MNTDFPRSSDRRIRASLIAALIFLSFLLAAAALAQTPGMFTPTGKMTTPRFFHTATTLADGRILIAGGFVGDYSPYGSGSTATATTELFDPATGKFTAAGNMNSPRANHTATLLANGKVLIAGGSQNTLASAELYDPSTGTFSIATSMPASEMYGRTTAALLRDSKVLLAGVPFGAELYDPSVNTFTATGGGIIPTFQTATTLRDGRVLLAYAFNSQLYDPASRTFSATGNTTGYEFQATLLANGSVLVTGGNDDPGASEIAEVYDPTAGMFTPTGNMISSRANHTSTLLPDGRVLITGGSGWVSAGPGMSYFCCLASAEVYDPLTGLFANTALMATGRAGHTATLLTDGRVLIAGGGSSSAELYTPGCAASCPPDPWQAAVNLMKATAGTDSLNFWQWAWYWQRSPRFAGAPAGFGVLGSIDNTPGLIFNIIASGGDDDGLAVVSAEQWVAYYRSSLTVVSGVVNAASHLAGAIAPGELVVVTGSGLGPAKAVLAVPDSSGRYAAQLAGTTVLVNGTPVPVIFTSATQVEAVVPDSLAGGTAQVAVTYHDETSASYPVPVAAAAPGIFTVDSTGQGHAESFDQNGVINTPAHWQGDVITLFATGLGQQATGVTIHGFNLPMMPLSVNKGAFPGVTQIQVPIPFGQDCDTDVVLQVGDAMSQPGVTIAIDICI